MILAEDEERLKRKIEKLKIRNAISCTYDECAGRLQEYVDLGCRHFIFTLRTFNEEKESFIEKIGSSF